MKLVGIFKIVLRDNPKPPKILFLFVTVGTCGNILLSRLFIMLRLALCS